MQAGAQAPGSRCLHIKRTGIVATDREPTEHGGAWAHRRLPRRHQRHHSAAGLMSTSAITERHAVQADTPTFIAREEVPILSCTSPSEAGHHIWLVWIALKVSKLARSLNQ